MTMTSSHRESRAQRIALVALFAALMAAFGMIPKINLPLGVPITAQTMGVMLAGCMLGASMGFQAMALFLLAVALGLAAVFSLGSGLFSALRLRGQPVHG